MGCDIHLNVEEKIKEQWEFIGGDFYSGRNYNLFAILANVRNGSGFARCDTGDPLNYIDEPRGLPANVSGDIREESDHWSCDGHSHSYFSLVELLNFDWTQISTQRGYVDAHNYHLFKEGGVNYLKGWSGDVGGNNTEKIDNEAMQLLCQDILKETGKTFLMADADKIGEHEKSDSKYTQIEWKTPYYKECNDFLSRTFPKLMRLAGNVSNFDNVRIVFWFDN